MASKKKTPALKINETGESPETTREEKSIEEISSVVEQEQATQETLNKLSESKPKLSYGEILKARAGERQAKVIAQRSETTEE